MPVKRRPGKARRALDSEEMEDMFYGPGTALIFGCGYCGGRQLADYSPQQQRDILKRMREDWERNSASIWAAWHARDDHDMYISGRFHGAPDKPWAATEFGEP